MEEVTCEVCSTKFDLSKTYYCPECGFEMHIYPPELNSYEEERINKYKEFYNNCKETLKSALAKSEEDKQKIAQLEKELADAQLKANESKGLQPKAFLLFKDGSSQAVGAVYEGRNTYGSRRSEINEPTHHKIGILGLNARHFCIEAINDDFILYDLVGDILSATNKPIDVKGIKLSNNKPFFIGQIEVFFTIAF